MQTSSGNEAIDGLCAQAKRVNGVGRPDTVRLDAGFFSGGHFVSNLGQFYENDITQTLLGVIGDPHGNAAVFFDAGPLVGF